MKSLSNLVNFCTTLTQNTSAVNQALMLTLLDDQHRYLIQKYFDNERQYQTTTIGGDDYTTTAVVASGGTSATLTAAWSLASCSQLTTFTNTNSDQRLVTFTSGSTAITWSVPLSSITTTTAISTVGVQAYRIPANISKIINDTITVGQLKFMPAPVRSRNEWDSLNFLPYTSDIVNYYFIYNGCVEFFPIPSTTGNIITINYKARVPNFSTSFLFSDTSGSAYSAGSTTFDYQKGTASGTAGSYTVTGASTPNWTTAFPSGDVTKYNLYFNPSPTKGDGMWYPISTIDSATSLTLTVPLGNVVTATATYAIGQLPLLEEDFHDMLAYGSLKTYYASIVKDTEKFQLYSGLYQERLDLLKAYAGTKSVNVDLGSTPNLQNPNLFLYSAGSIQSP